MAENSTGTEGPFVDAPETSNSVVSSMKELGVAFSGGGIRSAAFCSGVLRRLIKKEVEPDFLSCVSGGGYTGSAYVEWKFRKQDMENWSGQFFEHLRKHSGYICNWQNGFCEGFCDSFIVFLLLLVVTLLSVPTWGAFAFPIAFLAKLLFGKFVDGTLCREDANSMDCKERTFLFVISAGVFVAFHVVDYCIKSCVYENQENYRVINGLKTLLKLMQLVSGFTFAFTFIPWFIKDFHQYIHIALQLLLIFATLFFWFFIPILRNYSSLAILIYWYSYVVYWHVYEGKFFGHEYSEDMFRYFLAGSLFILAMASVLGDFPLRLVHMYNRWRLQRAFYHFNDAEKGCGCRGINCYDLFPGSHLGCFCIFPPERVAEGRDIATNEALTLGDLKDITPQYISNMVINGWRKNYKNNYCYITMSPKEISVVDHQPTQNDRNQNSDGGSFPSSHGEIELSPTDKLLEASIFGDKLTPHDIKLSSAMAMSAAAVSPYLGVWKEEQRQFTHALSVFGAEMAARIVYDIEEERNERCCGKAGCSWLWNFIIFGLLTTSGLLVIFKVSSFPTSPWWAAIDALGAILILGLLALVIFVYYCQNISCCESCSRWSVVHLPIYRFIRSILRPIPEGQTPPAMLHISDGGHFENYGLLPLLRLRLKKILIADGSLHKSDNCYGDGIISAMERARDILGCSFTSMGGGDVLTDIKEKYVRNEDFPRKYEFKVQYRVGENGSETAEEGHIILLAPRHPNKGKETRHDTWQSIGEELSDEWGSGPFLTVSDVNKIAGCPQGFGCCESRNCPSMLCCLSCLSFPRHPTILQFFTPQMFAAYHREGYRAAMECDQFLQRN